MGERKTEEEKINKKRIFLQKILGFRLTPSISAWKLAIALFLLIAIAYTVNGAGVIAKGNNLEVSGNATVQGNMIIAPNGGNVGIGEVAPNNVLDVLSNGTGVPMELTAINTGAGNTFGSLRLTRLTTSLSAQSGISLMLQDSTPARQEYGYIAARISTNTAGAEAGDLIFSVTDAGTTRVERMRITSAGNVGINTTTPTEKLDVNGRVKGTELCIGADCRNTWPAGGGGGGGEGWTDDGANVRLTNSTDKVGIGTTVPNSILHVFNSAGGVAAEIESSAGVGSTLGVLKVSRLTSVTTNQVGIVFQLQDDQPARQEYGYIGGRISANTNGGEGGDLIFSTTNAGTTRVERMRIDSSGNVGIGTTNPATGRLVVSGGNVDVSNNKIINLAAPTVSSDAATKGYVDAAGSGGGVTMMSAESASTYTHANAAKYCYDLSATAAAAMNGDITTVYTDWHLPGIEEAAVFEGTITDMSYVWTGSVYEPAGSGEWLRVRLSDGSWNNNNYISLFNVRCVR